MSITQDVLTTWHSQLKVAQDAAKIAGEAIRDQFGHRLISAYKSQHDIQLSADITAQKILVDILSARYPDYGIVAEEGEYERWRGDELIWVIDPLDGTNNFGYGIAHCASAITLFERDHVVLSLIYDPITGRSFSNAVGEIQTPWLAGEVTEVTLRRATLSLVTGYADEARTWGDRFTQRMSSRCKRVVNLWAPALDLALVSSGAIDAMVCRDAVLLDVCGGMFLVESVGGEIVDFNGRPLSVRRSMHDRPVSFIASRNRALTEELVTELHAFD